MFRTVLTALILWAWAVCSRCSGLWSALSRTGRYAPRAPAWRRRKVARKASSVTFSCSPEPPPSPANYSARIRRTFSRISEYATARSDTPRTVEEDEAEQEDHELCWHSERFLHDRVLLRDSLEMLRDASKHGIKSLKDTLQFNLIRNLGHERNKDYVRESIACLRQVMAYDGDDFSLAEKIEYIYTLLQSYGSTALLLSGGGSLAAFHLGVLRTLSAHQCLPHIIAGSSGGSVIAAIAGTRSCKELQDFLAEESLSKKKSWFKFASLSDALTHYREHGHLQDIEYFQEWLRELCGELTFLEARERSGKILNIVVSPAHTNEPPKVLNYINAPNVLVWSAVSASCAFPALFPPQDLKVKVRDSRDATFASTKSIARTKSGRFMDGSLGDDLPIEKLKEYFHVNFSIVSQTNLHAAPWLTVKRYLPSVLAYLCQSEFQHRFKQLEAIIPNRRLRGWLKLFHTPWEGDITMVLPMKLNPAAGVKNLVKALTRLDRKEYLRLIELGEAATEPSLEGIKCMTAIEKEINVSMQKLSTMISNRVHSPENQVLN
mmetsp:Transcript_13671/g.34353  ORF Transcript_13671/g.34353 Transcript_13671/m.34353 type:complete len:548 (-) Transcript_13671:2277-3920(-)